MTVNVQNQETLLRSTSYCTSHIAAIIIIFVDSINSQILILATFSFNFNVKPHQHRPFKELKGTNMFVLIISKHVLNYIYPLVKKECISFTKSLSFH